MNDIQPIARDNAEKLVAGYMVKVEQYAAVGIDDVRLLLGAAADRLLRDPIRRCGPTRHTVYPWNVVDYLCGYVAPRDRLRLEQADAE